MSKKQELINFINENVDFSKATEDVRKYWEIYSSTEEKEKPMFSDNGKIIIKYMQEHLTDMPMAKSKNIAEGIEISSRGVAGAMRKLVTDGWVEKIGENPSIYSLTENGKNIKIED